MQQVKRAMLVAMALAVVAVVVSACGSSGSSPGGSSSTPATVGGLPQTGPGLTEATAPSGTKQAGGTVYFSEGAEAPPNYIFPMTSFTYCSTVNTEQFSALMYRPLYWYGNNYTPTVDYNNSVAQAPVWSDGDKTVSITLNNYKWSNGDPVTSRNVEEYINVYKADPAVNYCGYAPGLFPDNVTSMSLPNSKTIVLHLDKAFDPEWFLYNELSQITPLPLQWDRTSLSQPAPSTDTGSLPDTQGPKTAEKVYNFLNDQAKDVSSWATSPVWSIVDGPWKLQSYTTQGQVTLVPNPAYTGPVKPTISKFVEVPFTSDTAIFNEIRSGGPSALTIAGLPPQDVPQLASVKAEGYTDNTAASYSFNYFVLNFHNPQLGPVFSQTYFRQAFQHLVDQDGWNNAFLNHTAVPTYSPLPTAPPSPLASVAGGKNPFPFSPSEAASILTANGWKVVPNGATTCVKPGTAAGDCGTGISKGEGISFNLDYQSGITTLTSEMNDLQAQAAKVGIKINLTNHPFATVIGAALPCTPKQAICKWTAENWGAGWIYSPDFLPTGELLYLPGAASNSGSYNNPTATKLINDTVYGPQTHENEALSKYATFMANNLPVVFGPTSIGTYGAAGGDMISSKLGGYAANAFGYMTPEDWYFVK